MNVAGETQTKRRHPDRVTLLPKHLEKIDNWVLQVQEKCKGVSLSRNQMLQWLLESKEAILRVEELHDIGSQFFQEDLFLKQVAAELKGRRAAGEQISLGDVMGRILPGTKVRKARSRKNAHPQSSEAQHVEKPLRSSSAQSADDCALELSPSLRSNLFSTRNSDGALAT
jgi:hypothetical protein